MGAIDTEALHFGGEVFLAPALLVQRVIEALDSTARIAQALFAAGELRTEGRVFFVGGTKLLLELVQGTALHFESSLESKAGEVFFSAALLEVFAQFGEALAFVREAVEFDAGVGQEAGGTLQIGSELALFLIENEGALFFLLLFLAELFEIGGEYSLFGFELVEAGRTLFELDLLLAVLGGELFEFAL